MCMGCVCVCLCSHTTVDRTSVNALGLHTQMYKKIPVALRVEHGANNGRVMGLIPINWKHWKPNNLIQDHVPGSCRDCWIVWGSAESCKILKLINWNLKNADLFCKMLHITVGNSYFKLSLHIQHKDWITKWINHNQKLLYSQVCLHIKCFFKWNFHCSHINTTGHNNNLTSKKTCTFVWFNMNK